MKSADDCTSVENTVVNLGAEPATQAIFEVEKTAKNSGLAEINKALNQLRRRMESLKRSLGAYRRQDTAGSL